MSANPIYLAGTFLFEGGGVAWAAWELWKIRPGRNGEDKETSAFARRRQDADSPKPPGHPAREHGQDDG